MTLADNYAAAQDPRVIAQVTAAIFQFTETVDTEAVGGANQPTQAQHAARLNLANRISLGLQTVSPLVLSACAFASITGNSANPTPDATVANAVASLWNLWSGL